MIVQENKSKDLTVSDLQVVSYRSNESKNDVEMAVVPIAKEHPALAFQSTRVSKHISSPPDPSRMNAITPLAVAEQATLENV